MFNKHPTPLTSRERTFIPLRVLCIITILICMGILIQSSVFFYRHVYGSMNEVNILLGGSTVRLPHTINTDRLEKTRAERERKLSTPPSPTLRNPFSRGSSPVASTTPKTVAPKRP